MNSNDVCCDERIKRSELAARVTELKDGELLVISLGEDDDGERSKDGKYSIDR